MPGREYYRAESFDEQIKRPRLVVPRPFHLTISSEDQLLELAIWLLFLRNDIPRPTSNLSSANILNLGSPPELIAVLIRSFRLLIV
jgi:hypothetical protein